MKKLEELPAVLQLDLILLKDYILSEVPSAALIYLYGQCSQEPFEGPRLRPADRYQQNKCISGKTQHREIQRTLLLLCKFSTQASALHHGTYQPFFSTIKRRKLFLQRSINHRSRDHNAKPYTIILPKRVSLAGWKNKAQTYYNVCWNLSGNFLWHARLDFLFKQYTPCAFRLHQACEQLYRALHLVHTLEIPREHDMEELISMTRKYDPELPKLFAKNKRESRLLETFKNAYTHSRYDPTFQVSYKDIRSIWPKVKRLRKITRKTCLKKLMLWMNYPLANRRTTPARKTVSLRTVTYLPCRYAAELDCLDQQSRATADITVASPTGNFGHHYKNLYLHSVKNETMKYAAHISRSVSSPIVSVIEAQRLRKHNPARWEGKTYYSLWHLTPMCLRINNNGTAFSLSCRVPAPSLRNGREGKVTHTRLAKYIIRDQCRITLKTGTGNNCITDTLLFEEQPQLEYRYDQGTLYRRYPSSRQNPKPFPTGTQHPPLP